MKLEEKLVCFLKFPRPVLIKTAQLEIRTVIVLSSSVRYTCKFTCNDKRALSEGTIF